MAGPRFRKVVQLILGSAGLCFALIDGSGAVAQTTPSLQVKPIETIEELGGTLFADRNLSFSRRQNCVSCHSPELAFTDPRQLGDVQGSVSRGHDGHSLGDRNAPTLAYVALAPRFRMLTVDGPEGGLFHDGRKVDLEEQAVDPLTNPVEMGMPNRASVVARVSENPSYVDALARLFGPGTLDDHDKAYKAIGTAIAAFERTKPFQAFDSRYDRSLRGNVELTLQEKAGRDLFFSEDASCSRCHLKSRDASATETFSNARYYNIGVPVNARVRKLNGKADTFVDKGLADNPAMAKDAMAKDPAAGRFRVPTLRNIAITGPYMHNGVFQDLRTAILFHDRFNPGAVGENPETNAPWSKPEVSENLAKGELAAPALTPDNVSALVAFLATLTDKTYENLLTPPQSPGP